METGLEHTPKVRTVVVTEAQDGQRIDNFLARELKGVPRSRLYRILRRGEVRVNKGRVKADYRLQVGDRIRIPPVRTAEAAEPGPVPAWLLQQLSAAVLYEDEDLLVVNKPAGSAVHGGSGLSYGLIEALRSLRPEAPALELVHRLDRETSGCLLLAKRRPALVALQAQMRRGTMDKRYLALVAGRWRDGERTVEAALRKNVLQGGERMVQVCADGKPAVTHFRPVTGYAEATLVEVQLQTGRTHQIRVHAAHIGHPLAGDAKYGSGVFNKRMRTAGLRRLFLHAHSLAFLRPGSDEPIHISAPLEAGLQQVLDRLDEHGN